MSAQSGDLFGNDAAAEQIERLFVGLILSPDVAAAASKVLERARAEHGLKGPPVRPDRLHVTLIHIGDYRGSIPRSIVADTLAAVGEVSSTAFDLTFDRVASFAGAPGRRPCVLLGSDGVEAVRAFRDRLFRALVRAGVRTLSREAFNPHITLAYGDRLIPEQSISPVGWRATEFLLIHSEVGRSTYHTLGRWPLHD